MNSVPFSNSLTATQAQIISSSPNTVIFFSAPFRRQTRIKRAKRELMASLVQRRVYASTAEGGGGDWETAPIHHLARAWLDRIDELNPMFDEESDRLMLFVDFLLLADDFPDLAEYMHCCPEEFARLVAHVMCDSAESFADARLWLRPVNISALFRAPKRGGGVPIEMHNRLQLLSGRLCSVDAPAMEVWSRTVKCWSSSCESGGFPFKILSQGNFKNDNVGFLAPSCADLCRFCGAGGLVEDLKGLSVFPVRMVTLCLDRNSSSKDSERHQLHRTIRVRLQDDLAEEGSLVLGAQVQVVGHLKASKFRSRSSCKGTSSEDLEFVAWNVFPVSALKLSSELFTARSLVETRSPSSFADAVVEMRSIMDLILPALPLFWRLKLMCLCCMAATPSNTDSSAGSDGSNRTRLRLHLLACGGYHQLARAIIRSIDDFSPTSTCWIGTSDGNGIVPKVTTDGAGISRLESSELMFALGGVACFPNILAVHKPADVNALRRIMDSQDLVLGKDSAAMVLPCNVSIVGMVPDHEDWQASNWKGETLLRHFDLVHDMREEPGKDDFDEAVSSFLLDSTIPTPASDAEEEQKRTQLRERIHRATIQHTEFEEDSEALDLILAFYHATRQALAYGTAGGQHYDLLSLRRIARTAAQLRLSPTIEVFDAVLAISLNEETRAAKKLPTILAFDVLPNGRSNIELYGSDEVEAYTRFYNRILGVCQAHGTLQAEDAESPGKGSAAGERTGAWSD